jgi:hypothetical protein
MKTIVFSVFGMSVIYPTNHFVNFFTTNSDFNMLRKRKQKKLRHDT